MSRVGKRPIPIPAGVTVTVQEANLVVVKGPKGELTRQLHPEVIIEQKDGHLTVDRPSENRLHKSLHGLSRTLLANMVQGVTDGYSRTLELVGTGYRATKAGDKVTMTVGFSHPVEIHPPAGIALEVPAVNSVVVRGIDKELVGQVAANIRGIRPPEPYLGKGIRYAGERIIRKVGKTGKK